MTRDSLRLIIELRSSKVSDLVIEVHKLPSVLSASIISHDGEVTY